MFVYVCVIDQAVKIAGYRPSFFLAFLWTKTKSRSGSQSKHKIHFIILPACGASHIINKLIEPGNSWLKTVKSRSPLLSSAAKLKPAIILESGLT